MPEDILTIKNISKSFPKVIANKNVSFNIKRNSVHALLGENGAGKSTLVKILYGLLKCYFTTPGNYIMFDLILRLHILLLLKKL